MAPFRAFLAVALWATVAPAQPDDAAGGEVAPAATRQASSADDAELAALASSSDAAAAPPIDEDPEPYQAEPSRFQAGVRVGVELPMGEGGEGGSFGDELTLVAPLWLDLTGRIGEVVRVGGYAGMGLSLGAIDCSRLVPAATDDPLCNFSLIRLGGQVQIDLLRIGESGALWLGGGLGYEWSKLRAQYVPEVTDPTQLSGSEKISEERQGMELLLQGGLEFAVFDDVRFGPYLTYLVAPASTAKNECSGQAACPADPDGTSFHGWLGVGARLGVGF